MKSRTRTSILLSQLMAISTMLPTMAQIPGIQTAPAPGSANSPNVNKTVLSGQIKTDIIPAEKLLSQGKYSDAEGLFRDILVNSPQDVQATLGLATALAKQFKLDGADDLFDRVLMSDPNNGVAYAGKATVILNRLQSSSGSIRDNRDSYLKQAEEYANRACRLAPAQAEAHYALGQVYKEQGRIPEASSELGTAVSLDPQHSYAYSALGSIKLDQNSLAEAADCFKQAIALNSGNSTAHYGLGATLLKLGQVDNAIQELNISLYQFPNSWPVRMALGQAYQQQGNSVAAIKEYQLSTLIKPENTEPYLRMADIREDRGDLEMGLADLRSGLTQSPYDLALRQRIADITLRLEKPDDAIKAYRTILQMSPNNPQAIKGLSQALYLKAQKAAVGALLASNDYETAISTLDEAIKLNPNDMELQLSKAKLMSLSGTKADLSKMAQPANDGERIAYAQALMATGDYQKASTLFQAVVNDLTDPKQAYAVADIGTMIKDLDDAEFAYRKGMMLAGSPERGQRGIDQITQLRKSANDNAKVASELAKKNQWDGAVDRYRQALGQNPRLPLAHYGLAQALEKSQKANSSMLKEAVQHYQYYMAMQTDLTQKDREKMAGQIEKLADKASKLKQKEDKNKR
ncbi:MAG: tetratricopeptide repeat protein [Candidatus Obscuribacterales bacterium]|nr:tetratricopeptide repeat protein [Candidatus Obscuribacterales bacterium]